MLAEKIRAFGSRYILQNVSIATAGRAHADADFAARPAAADIGCFLMARILPLLTALQAYQDRRHRFQP